MKPEGQVKHRLNQALYRHLKREISTSLSRRPDNCVHNGDLSGTGIRVHLCLLPTVPGKHDVCDQAHGGLEKAKSCPYFECKHSKESVKAKFVNFVSKSSRALVAEKYPDVAAYFWVLGMEDGVGSTLGDRPKGDGGVGSLSVPPAPAQAPARWDLRPPGEPLYEAPLDRGSVRGNVSSWEPGPNGTFWVGTRWKP